MKTGDTWKSRVLNQEFEVISGEARMKPEDYPFDFVLL